MIIANFYIMGVTVRKPETNAPLIVDGYGILTGPIAFESVQPVAGGNAQTIEIGRGINGGHLSKRTTENVRRQAAAPA